ncbi:MAG: tRNA (guanosine(37)-N1)-methyltransferase TrmD [Bdellovibrionota bacterium]
MKFTYLTLFPELIQNYLGDALLKKAEDKKLLEFNVINLRKYSDNKYNSVDDTAYGGGDGMLLRPDIADKCFNDLYKTEDYKPESTLRIYLSPQGEKLEQATIHKLLKYDHLILLSGRYGGIDQRIINHHIDLEISLGDFVLSGGELASLALTESLSRFIPGVLGHDQSVIADSFHNGLLEAPQFTKPSLWGSEKVPAVLLSGHHEKIAVWKNHMGLLITWKKRKDLFLKSQKELVGPLLKNHLKFLNEITVEELQSVGLTQEDLDQHMNEVKSL